MYSKGRFLFSFTPSFLWIFVLTLFCYQNIHAQPQLKITDAPNAANLGQTINFSIAFEEWSEITFTKSFTLFIEATPENSVDLNSLTIDYSGTNMGIENVDFKTERTPSKEFKFTSLKGGFTHLNGKIASFQLKLSDQEDLKGKTITLFISKSEYLDENNKWNYMFGNSVDIMVKGGSANCSKFQLELTGFDEDIMKQNSGEISAIASNGVSPYYYELVGRNISNQDGWFRNLVPGKYTVRVTDSNEPPCTTTKEIIVYRGYYECRDFQMYILSTDETGLGKNNGTITSIAMNGIAPYFFELVGKNIRNQDGKFAGLTPGFYIISVADSNDPPCIETGEAIIKSGSTICKDFSISLSKTNETFSGRNDGSITATASLGLAPYTYELVDKNVKNRDGKFTGLAPGFYTVQVIDSNNPPCIITDTTGIIEGSDPCVDFSLELTSTPVTNSGGEDGSITAKAINGFPPYFYELVEVARDISEDGIFTNLSEGAYLVKAWDSNNPPCSVTKEIIVDKLNRPCKDFTLSLSKTDETEPGKKDGTITAIATKGKPPYQFELFEKDLKNQDGKFTGLAPGSYTVLVSDSNKPSCFDSESIEITNANPDHDQSICYSIPSSRDTFNNGSLFFVSLDVNLKSEIFISKIIMSYPSQFLGSNILISKGDLFFLSDLKINTDPIKGTLEITFSDTKVPYKGKGALVNLKFMVQKLPTVTTSFKLDIKEIIGRDLNDNPLDLKDFNVCPSFPTITIMGECQPPQSINISNLTDNSVELTWPKPRNDFESYSVTITPNYKHYVTKDPYLKITGLEQNTVYSLNITIICDSSNEATGVFSFKTRGNNDLCNPPSDIKVSNITPESVDLSWNTPAGDKILDYSINIIPGNLSFTTSDTFYTIKDLARNTTYLACIRTNCINGKQSESYCFNFKTTDECGDVISDPTINYVDATSAKINWKATNDVQSFEVLVNPGNKSYSVNEPFFNATNLMEKTNYTFCVNAICKNGYKSHAKCTSIKTKPLSLEDQIYSNNFSIYPNPTDEILTLTIPDSKEGTCQITIFDLSGKQITTQNEYLSANQTLLKLHVGDLPAGLYRLRIKLGDVNTDIPFSKIN